MAEISLNLDALMRMVSNAKERISDKRIGDTLRGAVIEAFKFALKETPQWSGHMAANLTIEVDGYSKPASAELYLGEDWRSMLPDPKRKGDDPGVGIAKERNSWVNDHPFTIETRSKIFYKDIDYDSIVEAGWGLRGVNKDYHAIARAKAYIKSRYGGRGTWTRIGLKKERI